MTAREVLDELADKSGLEYEEMLVMACAFIDALRSPWAFKEFIEQKCQVSLQEEDEITLVDISHPKIVLDDDEYGCDDVEGHLAECKAHGKHDNSKGECPTCGHTG